MDFDKDYILVNDIVALHPLTWAYKDELLHYAINEPTLWQYSLTPADGKDNMNRYIEMTLTERSNKKSYPFVVYDKRKNKVAGSTRFYDYNEKHNTTQLGYTWYGKEFWGTGLNKNSKFLMLEFAFEKLNLDRVEFRADNNNKRSIAAMKSIGCMPEGVLRSNCQAIKGRRDSIVLSILKDEWNNKVRTNLINKCKHV